MKFTITRASWSSLASLEVEIDAKFETTTMGVKLGAAVKVAYKSDADLSGAVLRGAVLRGADLRDADLSDADLRDADLSGADLRDADLRGADLRDADLSGAVLRGADLRGADLRDADLSGADLRGADLRDADLSDVPVIPDIDAKILAAIEGGGTLKMDTWHTCETTHCRAGWAITIAGEAGKALEDKFGSAAAGALIYMKSTPDERIPNFYAGDAAAMADIKARAKKQTAALKE